MSECIFCMVACGGIPASIVYADDLVVAFDDIAPQAPVHTLIVPKEHYADLADDVPDEIVQALHAATLRVAEIKGVADSGYRAIVNTGGDAGQTVHHLHVHVLGGKRMAEGMVTFRERT